MDKQAVLEKIKKCLALSKSANEHEAAQAMKQAQALMKKYEVDAVDVVLSEVSERGSGQGAYGREKSATAPRDERHGRR